VQPIRVCPPLQARPGARNLPTTPEPASRSADNPHGPPPRPAPVLPPRSPASLRLAAPSLSGPRPVGHSPAGARATLRGRTSARRPGLHAGAGRRQRAPAGRADLLLRPDPAAGDPRPADAPLRRPRRRVRPPRSPPREDPPGPPARPDLMGAKSSRIALEIVCRVPMTTWSVGSILLGAK